MLIAVVLIAVPIVTSAFQSPVAPPPVRPTLTEAQKQMLKAAETDLSQQDGPIRRKG